MPSTKSTPSKGVYPMSPTDFRVLCTALGFTAMAMQGDITRKENAGRARSFARLIEEFCRTSMPEAFENAAGENASNS